MSSGNGMMSIQNLDRLKELGVDEQHARGFLEVLYNEAVSKDELQTSTNELKRDIERIKSDLKIEIKKLDVKIETVKS